MSIFFRSSILCLASLLFLAPTCEAQILRNLTRKAERALERKAEDKVEEAVILGVEKALESDSTQTRSDSTKIERESEEADNVAVKDKATPFSALIQTREGLEVDFEGDWYRLISIGGITADELRAYAEDQKADDWLGYLVENTAGSLRALGVEFTNTLPAVLVHQGWGEVEKEVRFYNANQAFQRDYHTLSKYAESMGTGRPPRKFPTIPMGSFSGTDWKNVSGRAQPEIVLGIDEDTDAKDLTRAIFGLKSREKEQQYVMVYLFAVETPDCGDISDKILKEAPFLSFPVKARPGYATKTLNLYNFIDEDGDQQPKITQATTFFRAEVTKVEGDVISGYIYYPEMEGDAFHIEGSWSVRLCPEG